MAQQKPGWPVDGHVHFHRLGRVAPTLDAAVRNFQAVNSARTGLLGALLLTQGSAERVFESLHSSTAAGDWMLGPVNAEPESLVAHKCGISLAIICGRQVRAVDGLEVLALGTCETFPDGLPLLDTIRAVQESGALTVLPWGFGKWLGNRGRQVEVVLRSLGKAGLFVGDNGGRLDRLGVPGPIRAAEQQGFRVIPGSDPFPFGADYRRVGRFGFIADVTVPADAPWRALRAWLVAQQVSPRPYGRALGSMAFLFNQIGIQAHNRLFRGSSG